MLFPLTHMANIYNICIIVIFCTCTMTSVNISLKTFQHKDYWTSMYDFVCNRIILKSIDTMSLVRVHIIDNSRQYLLKFMLKKITVSEVKLCCLLTHICRRLLLSTREECNESFRKS